MKRSIRLIGLMLALALTVGVLSVCVGASDEIMIGVGIVDASALRLRSGPSTSSQILDNAFNGEYVMVIEKVGDWYKVQYNLKEGYMHSDYLIVKERENVELGNGTINSYLVNLRSKPTTSSSVVAQAKSGATCYTIGFNCGWYKVIYNGTTCYVRSDLLDLKEYPYENRASSNSPKYFRNGDPIGTISTGNSGNSGNSGTTETPVVEISAGQQIVNTAMQYKGYSYVWGGSSPSGFDCSGLVQYVMKACGYSIGRTCTPQYNGGKSVSKSDLQPGDLVFFANTYTTGLSHVGIYIGNNQFIHAANSHDGVKITSMSDSYYAAHYYGACRYTK